MLTRPIVKFINENEMTILDKHGLGVGGIFYGKLRGYMATVYESSSFLTILFATTFPDPAKRGEFVELMKNTDIGKLRKPYLLHQVNVEAGYIKVVLLNALGILDKANAFLDWFIPLLQEHGATGANVCLECGDAVPCDRFVYVNGIVYNMHESCAQKVEQGMKVKKSRLDKKFSFKKDNFKYL